MVLPCYWPYVYPVADMDGVWTVLLLEATETSLSGVVRTGSFPYGDRVASVGAGW